MFQVVCQLAVFVSVVLRLMMQKIVSRRLYSAPWGCNNDCSFLAQFTQLTAV